MFLLVILGHLSIILSLIINYIKPEINMYVPMNIAFITIIVILVTNINRMINQCIKELKFFNKEELPDLFALSDVVISRAGANAICEISALHKPNLLIPLSANASRGDQILNARSFEKQGFSMVLEEEEITDEKLLDTIHQLYDNRHSFEEAMSAGKQMDSIHHIVSLIEECVLSKK